MKSQNTKKWSENSQDLYIKNRNAHIENVWAAVMKTLGIGLVFFFLGLVIMVLYGWFYDICKLYHLVYKNYYITTGLVLLGLFIGFSIIFNFAMAVLTPCGGTENLVQEMKEMNEKNSQDADDIEQFKVEYKSIDVDEKLEEDNNYGLQKMPFDMKKCSKCHNPKPPRAHHCSVCRKCVLKMDHHCPWINNCVGYYNHRYFLLMLTWLLIGVSLYTTVNLPVIALDEFRALKPLRSSVYVLNFTLTIAVIIVMIPFNLWNWFLAWTGQTTIEFWEKKSKKKKEGDNYKKYSFDEKTKNLEVIFGTRSLFKMLLPSVRKLKGDGINWETQTDESITIQLD